MENSLASCQNCLGNCCYIPKISGFIAANLEDVRKIQTATNLKYQQFLTFRPLPNSMVQEMKDDLVDFPQRSIESALRLRLLTADNRILRIKAPRGQCYFLDEKEQCSIYEIAPGICQLYPFWYSVNQQGISIILHEGGDYCLLSKKYHSLEELPEFETERLIKAAVSIEAGLEEYLSNVDEFVRVHKIRK